MGLVKISSNGLPWAISCARDLLPPWYAVSSNGGAIEFNGNPVGAASDFCRFRFRSFCAPLQINQHADDN